MTACWPAENVLPHLDDTEFARAAWLTIHDLPESIITHMTVEQLCDTPRCVASKHLRILDNSPDLADPCVTVEGHDFWEHGHHTTKIGDHPQSTYRVKYQQPHGIAALNMHLRRVCRTVDCVNPKHFSLHEFAHHYTGSAEAREFIGGPPWPKTEWAEYAKKCGAAWCTNRYAGGRGIGGGRCQQCRDYFPTLTARRIEWVADGHPRMTATKLADT